MTGHKVDVMHRVRNQQLNFLPSRGGELILLQLQDVPHFWIRVGARGSAGFLKMLLLAVNFQMGLQVVQSSKLQATLWAGERLFACV